MRGTYIVAGIFAIPTEGITIADIQAMEERAWNEVLTDPDLDARFDAALAAGAQTREGELDLGKLLDPPR